ncbi:MAG: C1 family peptidase [Colwellia sp.]|nr:C1 family peptidase [Colwellia sp.]
MQTVYAAKSIDLRSLITTPIHKQGLLNSCIACALSIAVELLFKEKSYFFDDNDHCSQTVSTMFIYYHMRLIENKLADNVPLVVDESVSALVEYGVCSEVLWPYPTDCRSKALEQLVEDGCYQQLEELMSQELINKKELISNTLAERPSLLAKIQANKTNRINAVKLNTDYGINELRTCLLNGVPFIFGLDIPLSFLSCPKSGKINIPPQQEKRLGGHAFITLGFDDERQVFICRNSLGEAFGDNGYCYIPYDFILASYFEDDGTEVANTFSFWYLTM